MIHVILQLFSPDPRCAIKLRMFDLNIDSIIKIGQKVNQHVYV